ncbi:BnaA04g13740D [Brassica napus]|uniref:BnaA04g13740D protein n=1 Tax=Brassica napus TaxID=3708 RepID=A0A078HQA3_BRANA|nr:BnaA04g13740D [Brassica napus]
MKVKKVIIFIRKKKTFATTSCTIKAIFSAMELFQLLKHNAGSKKGKREEPEAVCACPWALPRHVDLLQGKSAAGGSLQEAAGHNVSVSAVDLAASDKVILVAHSMGGISAAFAGDIFPHTIAAFVYLTAFMPDKETHLLIMFYNRVFSFGNKVHGHVFPSALSPRGMTPSLL